MARSHSSHLVPASLAAASHAGEMRFPATVSAGDALVVVEKPDLPVIETAADGSRVSRGDLLVEFDGGPLDYDLTETREAIARGTAALSALGLELETLKEAASRRLDSLRRAAENAKEAHALFIRTRRKAAEESAVKSLRVAEEILASQRQELARLAKWQDAGDSASGLGETMLENHEDDMAAAEFSMRMEMFNHRRVVDVLLPREARNLEDTARETALGSLKAEAEIPMVIELKSLAMEALKNSLARSEIRLVELEKTRGLLEARAPADGWFHHDGGDFKFVPADAIFEIIAFVDAETASNFAVDLAVGVVPESRPEFEIPAKITGLIPEPDRGVRVVIAAVWPDGFFVEPGSGAEVRISSAAPPLS